MPIRIRCREKPPDRQQVIKSKRGEHVFGNKSQGVVYGQETRTPHLMRIGLIIDRRIRRTLCTRY